MPSELIKLLTAHPDQPWDWVGLSSNPNMTMEFVMAHPDQPWDWDGLSSNPNMTLELVMAHPDQPWNWSGLSSNQFKYDRWLQRIHINKMKKFRAKIKSFKIKNWYQMFLLTKDPSQCFWKWYCGEPDGKGGGVGRKVDHARIEAHFRSR